MSRSLNRKPTHPGVLFLEDVLQPLKVKITDAADAMGISRKHLSLFVNGRIPCTKDMARRIAKASNTSMGSWLNMQTALDVWEAEHENIQAEKYAGIKSLVPDAA
ncbi:MAG: HigA family addiction module antitoxin [Motiliproteus sp.]